MEFSEEQLKALMSERKILPLSAPKPEGLLVVDRVFLPSEIKDGKTVEEITDYLQIKCGVTVLLIDSSRLNTEGIYNNNVAVYKI